EADGLAEAFGQPFEWAGRRGRIRARGPRSRPKQGEGKEAARTADPCRFFVQAVPEGLGIEDLSRLARAGRDGQGFSPRLPRAGRRGAGATVRRRGPLAFAWYCRRTSRAATS